MSLISCSQLEDYTIRILDEANEILDKVNSDEDASEKEREFSERMERQEEPASAIELTETTCLGERGTCEEVGNRYLSTIWEEAFYILEGPIADDTYMEYSYHPIVSYLVDGNEIYDPITETDDTTYDYFLYDTDLHYEIWEQMDAIMPEDRDMLEVLIYYTDGEMNELASVEPTEEDPTKWILNIDIQDIDDTYIFINTIVHEYGHLLTLNDTQIETIMDPYLIEENPVKVVKLKASCHTYFTDFGCAREDSYIHAFYDQFWYGDLEKDWHTVNLYDEWEIYEFFERNYDDFIHDYAASSIYEDITESWTYFVFSERFYYPVDNWEKKVNFFYDYPELVELRAEILRNVATYLEET